jgi:hypothetical protein
MTTMFHIFHWQQVAYLHLDIVKRFFHDTNTPPVVSSPESIPGSSDIEESCIKVTPYINLNKIEELPEDLLQNDFLQNLLTGKFYGELAPYSI